MERRKRWALLAIPAALVVFAALAWLFACLAAGRAAQTGNAPIMPDSVRDFLRADLTYDAGTRTLRGTQTATLTNREGKALEEIMLRAYMNGENEDAVAITGVKINGQSAAISKDEDDPTVLRIRHDWAAGERLELSFTVMIRHAKTEGASIIMLPSLAMLEDGVWRGDAYDELADPSYAQPFDFTVVVDGGVAAQMRMARDASFALLEGGKTREKEISGVRIRVLAQDTGTAKTLMDQAQAALESLNGAGIAYPYDTLTIAQSAAGGEEGAAYSGLIALEAADSKEELRRRITRLMARALFGIWVESDPWNAPWLSHTLCACCELLAFRQLKGEAAYEQRFYGEIEPATRLTRPAGVTVGGTTAHFGSRAEMTQVLRDQGAAMLMGIEQAVGEAAFVTALNLYAENCAGQTGSQAALEAALESATGSSWSGYLADGLTW